MIEGLETQMLQRSPHSCPHTSALGPLREKLFQHEEWHMEIPQKPPFLRVNMNIQPLEVSEIEENVMSFFLLYIFITWYVCMSLEF